MGLTLACFLHSEHGTAFVVKDGATATEQKGKVLPFKDVVSLRPDVPEAPAALSQTASPRKSLRAAKKTLQCALATVDQALVNLGEETTPSVKNTFLEFLPKRRTTRPKRKTCGARFADVVDVFDHEEESDAEAELVFDASPHVFPEEYDLPDAWPLAYPEGYGPSSQQAGAASPIPFVAHAIVPMAMDPQQMFTMNMQLAQGLFAAQQQVAMLQAQMQEQARQIVDLDR